MSILISILAAVFGFALAYYIAAQVQSSFAVSELGRERRARPRRGALVDAWVRGLQRFVPLRLEIRVRRAIVMAGGLQGLSTAELILWGVIAGLAALALGVWFALATSSSLLLSPVAFIAGALYPFLWLHDRIKRRHLAILSDLPYQLDLLTLSVEAGLDFGAGVARVVERGKPGPLRDEFSRMLAEIRVGKTRAEAMEHMSRRVGLAPLSSFLSAMIQADRLGTGIGATLRIQADQLRNDRFQRAEKAAGEAPVKMLIPLVLFVFPTIWVILAAPLLFEWLYRGAAG